MTAHARQLRERGFAVLPDVLGRAQVATARAIIDDLLAEIRPPKYYAPDSEPVSDAVTITSTGLALSRPLHQRPALHPLALPTRLVSAMRDVLGADVRLELSGAVVSDHTRGFFPWHTHIDGEEEGARMRTGVWRPIDTLDRVLTILYLDDLDDRTGPLYVLPRRVGDPTTPPHDTTVETWPEMIELRPRAGTVVALEQCTWHAAKSLTEPGLRMFLGSYWAAAAAPRPPWFDDSLPDQASLP